MSTSFPLSRSRVLRDGFDPAKDNPLAVLHPHEATVAELFVLAAGDPMTARTMPPGKDSTYKAMRSGAFLTRFREAFGYEMSSKMRSNLEKNPAWRCYAAQLRTQTRDAVMAKLKMDALSAYQDFKWSREKARLVGDYKETRLAAGDHLDRIGATEKPEAVAHNVVVVLKGRNFDEATLMRELPSTTVEVVTVTETP